ACSLVSGSPIDMSCQFSYDTDDPPPLGPKGTFSLYKKLFSIQCTDENCKTPIVILAPKRENYHQLDLEAEMFQWKFADGIPCSDHLLQSHKIVVVVVG